jgi:hypothetical protein
VRFLIGDTDPDIVCTLSNEEIDWVLEKESNDLSAAAKACQALRAKAVGLKENEKANLLAGICSGLKAKFESGGS